MRLRTLILLVLVAGPFPMVVPAASQQRSRAADPLACAPCHGIDGIARDEEVPHLAGQHEVYLYNQLAAFRSGRRKQADMHVMARDMTDEDMQSLARYFASLPRE